MTSRQNLPFLLPSLPPSLQPSLCGAVQQLQKAGTDGEVGFFEPAVDTSISTSTERRSVQTRRDGEREEGERQGG